MSLTRTLSERFSKLSFYFEQSGLEQMLLTSRIASRYFADFSGSSSALLLREESAYFITDGRYAVAASAVPNHFDVQIQQSPLAEHLEKSGLLSKGSLGIEGNDATFTQIAAVKKVRSGLTIKDISSGLQAITSVHDTESLKRLRKALSITKEVFLSIEELLKFGVQEREVAAGISFRGKMLGAEGDAFAPVVAFGTNAALPHAEPGARKWTGKTPVLLDFGFQHKGVCSDITRMIIPEYAGNNKVLRAKKALEQVFDVVIPMLKPGAKTAELDARAREVLQEHSLDVFFTHALGHGLGYDVHQSPRIGRGAKEVLAKGNVVTIEPGIYIEGQFGIRLENDYLITNSGAKNLSVF